MFTTTTQLDASAHPQPRPTALLTCKDNIMPLSWHMPISKEPFRYAFCVRDENYTFGLLHKFKDCALNFLDISYLSAYQICGEVHGEKVDKYSLANLSKKEAEFIDSTLINEAYTIYECSIIDILNYGDHDIFIADVVFIHNKIEEDISPTLFMGRGTYETTSKNPKRAEKKYE